MTSNEWFKNVTLDMQICILIQGYVYITFGKNMHIGIGQIDTNDLTCLSFNFWCNNKDIELLEDIKKRIEKDNIIKSLPAEISQIVPMGLAKRKAFLMKIYLTKLTKEKKENLFGYFALKGYDEYINA